MADGEKISTSFPAFTISDGHAPTGSCLWTTWDYAVEGDDAAEVAASRGQPGLVAPGFASPTCRAWNSSTQLPGGLAGTGPFVVFADPASAGAGEALDPAATLASPTFVVSPFANVMSINLHSAGPGQWAFGLMGNATDVPSGLALRVALTLGEGVNGAVAAWGDAVRAWNGKPNAQAARHRDVTLQYLGYTTDNGAYYYYNTVAGGDYLDTVKAVKQYADRVGLPYKWVLLDSWWYEHGAADGTHNWTDADASIFPGGMAAAFEATGWFVMAHNRWWDPDNVYARTNGGQYEFSIDNTRGGAVPLEQQFWDDLLANTAKWGLRVYEQDWLFNEFAEKVSGLQQDPNLARRWLLQMGRGAAKHGLSIQYCMPYARHLLQSLEVPAVTQARASDDALPGSSQWSLLGGQAVLYDALGLAPSKDGFWSTSLQPDNPYQDNDVDKEPYPELQSAVVTLSAGPVSVGDGIGHSNVPLVLRSCMADGRLLQPSAPAKLIDAAFHVRADPTNTRGPHGEVWVAWSYVANRRVGYVLAAELDRAFTLRPHDATSVDHVAGPAQGGARGWWALDVRQALAAGTDGSGTVQAETFSPTQGLRLRKCGDWDFEVFALLPVERNGWALAGEVFDKWVGVSQARFLEVTTTPDSMLAEVVGAPGETVTLGFVSPNGTVVRGACTLSDQGSAKIVPGGCFSDF